MAPVAADRRRRASSPAIDDAIRVSTLPNGIRVATESVPGARSVCTGAWVGVGARDEPAELSGVSHFLEHLLFKGTATRSAREINEAVDRVGGEMNAFTTKEYTAYYTRLPAGLLDQGVTLLGDVLSAPALRDADVESERQVICEEIAMDDDTPDDRVHTMLFEAVFPDHPLGRETAGQRESVEAITADDVRAFFDSWYRPANVVVAVAGDVDHDQACALVQEHFTRSAGGERPQREAPGSDLVALATAKRPTEQAHVSIGYRGLARTDPDREALDVLNHVLGGGMSSRLFEEIREKRGLAYSVFSAPSCYRDAGAWSVYVGTSPSRLGEVVKLVDAELAKVVDDGITDDDLDVAVGYLTGSYLMGLEDASSRMARMGGQLAVFDRIVPVDDQLARYRTVTTEHVQAVAARVLGAPRSVAVVGPLTAKAVRTALA